VRQAEADMVARSLHTLQSHSKTTPASLQGSEGDQSPHVQEPLTHILCRHGLPEIMSRRVCEHVHSMPT